MGAELRKKILDKLTAELLETKGEIGDEGAKLVGAYYNSLSDDVCHTIGEINDVSAPFVIAVFETLAESIRKLYPGHDETIDLIRELPKLEVVKNKEIEGRK